MGMLRKLVSGVLLVSTIIGCQGRLTPIAFEDVTDRVGLGKYLERWTLGHGAGWGDVNGDDRPDLYIGAFADRDSPYAHPDAPIPNQLFINTPAGFVLSDQESLQLVGKRARTTGTIFVDLDNDGDLDLFVSNHANSPTAYQSVLFENDGEGRFRDVTPRGVGDWPARWAPRNAIPYDFNRDGLLDLVLTDGAYRNWKDGGGRLLVLENLGGWKFRDAGDDYGFPREGTCGMGLGVGDVNDDGMFDFFVADCNRLFVSTPERKYRECQPGYFVQPPKPNKGQYKGSHACGAAFGDLNEDGLLDLVTTEHGQPSRIHVYVNQGIENGFPKFLHVSEKVGLGAIIPGTGATGLSVKGAHVAIVDMDNDGLRDIFISMIYKDSQGTVAPFVLRNLGVSDSLPRFELPPLESFLGYYAPAPVADYDRDGKLDIFLATWGQFRDRRRGGNPLVPDIPSYLFRNVSEGGNWLTLRVVGDPGEGFNPMGIGATVRAYKCGLAGNLRGLIDRCDIAVGTGYSSGEEALAHIGLGENQRCDVVVTWENRKKVITDVAANQFYVIIFREK